MALVRSAQDSRVQLMEDPMGKSLLLGAFVFGALFLGAATSHSDVAPSSAPTPRPTLPPSTDAVAEPITGTAEMPAPGAEMQRHDPFTPYDVGPTVPTKKTPKPL